MTRPLRRKGTPVQDTVWRGGPPGERLAGCGPGPCLPDGERRVHGGEEHELRSPRRAGGRPHCAADALTWQHWRQTAAEALVPGSGPPS